jgi:DNA (cytosine-5)-methyltransferase 1
MKYGSVCSGVEAATRAWQPLGWKAQFFSEILEFPSAVLAHHYPEVPNHGDFTTITKDSAGSDIDLLVGGTPCQSFSVAGKRLGLDDPRGNLSLEFCRLAKKLQPRWIVWENVEGVLHDDGGETFSRITDTLAECGYGWAYRVFDAQNFGVPQRRKRVFIVGYLGDWRRAAAVLFESKGVSWNPPTRKKKSKVSPTLFGSGAGVSRTSGTPAESDYLVTDEDVSRARTLAFSANDNGCDASTVSPTLRAGGHDKSHANGGVVPAVLLTDDVAKPLCAHQGSGYRQDLDMESYVITGPDKITDKVSQTINQRDSKGAGSYFNGSIQSCQLVNGVIRRLLPIETERLQGFPDNYTAIPYKKREVAADSHRYRAMGNSMAVPVMRWIGERIQMVEDIFDGA